MNLSVRPKMMIGIIGGHLHNTSPQAMHLAELAGELLGLRGAAVVCGGENGIMEAVCQGCKRAGGVTIGILKSNRKTDCNAYLDYIIPTSLDLAFMNVLVWSSDGILAFDGRYGTMTEIGLALDIGKPLVAVGQHRLIRTAEIAPDSPFAHHPSYDPEQLPQAIDTLMSFVEHHAPHLRATSR